MPVLDQSERRCQSGTMESGKTTGQARRRRAGRCLLRHGPSAEKSPWHAGSADPGYKGTAEIRLAAKSGELAGGCWRWESIKVIWRKALDAGDVNLVLQLVTKPHPELPKVPLAASLAKTEEARLLLQAAVHDPNSITRPSRCPRAHRRSRPTLAESLHGYDEGSGVVADAKKAQMDIDPVPGEKVEKTVARFFQLDPLW